ncbi:MAG TPA: DHA2 family efflux MFS transporter permease subunit [Mycobacteriales bacterium]|nr:DHA2 family efflux MFS transporter permease subunit [Mycobacteriales bacterium]
MSRTRLIWTFVVTSVAAFMVSLDNLIVTMALPSIREHLHAGLSSLEWTVNAYTLVFAVFLLTGAALGDKFGRKRVFTAGLAVFTAASAVAALAPNIEVLIAARAIQGLGGAMVLPLSMTILAGSVPAERRGAALGVWGAVSGLGVAVGPVVGGAVVEGAAWQWIFWLNVPIGLLAVPLAWTKLSESRATVRKLDLPGVALVSAGLFGIVFGVVRGNSHGWTSTSVLSGIIAGTVLLAAFLAWERRSPTPMLPLSLFTHRSFAAVNLASLLFSFGMFGAVFLLSQSLQTVQQYSPLGAGLRTLPWTAMPLLLAPIVGPLADRIGGKPLIVTGLLFQALGLLWLAHYTTTTVSYGMLVPGFVVAGIGMSLFFVPVGTVVFGSAPAESQGVASGVNNAIRELGGVFGVAVLSSVFSSQGSYVSRQSFIDGLSPAVYVGAGIVLVGAIVAMLIRNVRPQAAEPVAVEPAPELVTTAA